MDDGSLDLAMGRDLDARRWLEEKLRDHNVARTGAADDDWLELWLRDEHGGLVGGLAGWTWAGWLQIDLLWIDPRLRGRGDIVSLEETDIRMLDPSRLPELPDFATVDVSFISLKLVLPAIGKILNPRAVLLALIKPQFEAARSAIKKGIVRDSAVHAAVCDDIAAFLAAEGWRVGGVVPSPIQGGDGNREFLIEAERG